MKNEKSKFFNFQFSTFNFSLIFCLFALSLNAVTYYVDKNHAQASDTNPGTESLPWLTIQKAANTLVAGDTVIVKTGIYHERVILQNSGIQASPIVYKAYPGHEVVMEGSVEITGWQLYKDNIYYAEYNWDADGLDPRDEKNLAKPAEPAMLFENGVPMLRAQYPNQNNAYDPWDISLYLAHDSGDVGWLIDNDLTLPESDIVGAKVYDDRDTIPEGLENFAPIVTAYDSDQKKITTNGTTNYGAANHYALWNKLVYLDRPGEFFVDTSVTPRRIYVWAYDSQQPDNIKAAKLTNAFDFVDKKANHITVDGFIVRGYNYNNAASRGVFNLNPSVSSPTGISIRNNSIFCNINSGIYVRSGQTINIENNRIYRNGLIAHSGFGIVMGYITFDIQIRGNEIYGNSNDAVYLNHGSHDAIIINNHIYNHKSAKLAVHRHDGIKTETTATGICENFVIANNIIHDCGQNIYLETLTRNAKIYNNIIYNCQGSAPAISIRSSLNAAVNPWGLFNDNIILVGNTLLSMVNNGFTYQNTNNLTLSNNIIQGAFEWGDVYTQMQEIIRNNNLYVGLNPLQKSQYGWNLGASELIESNFSKVFIDDANNNYHLKTGSPAVDTGIDAGAEYNKDHDGVLRPQGAAWDIGAYEYMPDVNGTQAITLVPGWNWISFNALPADRSLDAIFGSIIGNMEQVRTQTQSALRLNGQWVGDLQNLDGIQQGAMFKVRVNAACTLTVTGTADLSANPIPLIGGWNWVAFYPSISLSLITSLSSIAGQAEQVRSQTQSTIYSNGQWIGDLTQMEPGKGYTIRMSGPGTLIYPGGQ